MQHVDRFMTSIHNVPCVIFVLVLFLSSGIACLTLWPVRDYITPTLTLNGRLIDVNEQDIMIEQNIAMREATQAMETIQYRTLWINVLPHLYTNVTGLALGIAVAVFASNIILLKGYCVSAVRPILVGIIVGVILSVIVSGLFRVFFIYQGDLNRMIPAGLFYSLFCPCAALYSVARWKKVICVGRCVRCGYDLTGNESGICSECGESLEIHPGRLIPNLV